MRHSRSPDRPAGVRTITPQFLDTARAADDFHGLPDGVSRWRLAAAIRAAARKLRLTGPMLQLLEHYIDLTYDQDWEDGSEPIIGKSLTEIAQHIGRSERQIRNIEHALMERGLLTWRDSGNHQRRSSRNFRTGKIIYAYGPSLGPCGARAGAIVAMANDARQEIVAARRSRMAISAHIRQITSLLSSACPTEHRDIRDEMAALPKRFDAQMDNDTLQGNRAKLETLRSHLENAICNKETAPANSANDDRHSPTLRKISGMEEISYKHNTDTSSYNFINECSLPANTCEDSHETQKIADSSALPPAKIVLAIAGEEASRYIANSRTIQRNTQWQQIINAAIHILPLMGIKSKTWVHACQQLGQEHAAAAVLIIERRASGDAAEPVQHPPAYLHGMIRKARMNNLNITRSIWSLYRYDQRKQRWSAKSGHEATLDPRMKKDGSSGRETETVQRRVQGEGGVGGGPRRGDDRRAGEEAWRV